jgi:hypothetical protein
MVSVSGLITTPGTIQIYVFDLQGRKVLAKDLEHSGGVLLEKLELTSLPAGSYIVELWEGNMRHASGKFVK